MKSRAGLTFQRENQKLLRYKADIHFMIFIVGHKLPCFNHNNLLAHSEAK